MATYRYYRISFSAIRTPASVTIQMAEWEVLAGGTPVTGQTAVSATHTNNFPNEAPVYASDLLASTKWCNDMGVPTTLTYDYGSNKVADSYLFVTANDAPDRDPAEWIVEGSTDNTTWITLDTQTAQVLTLTRGVATGTYPLIPDYQFGMSIPTPRYR